MKATTELVDSAYADLDAWPAAEIVAAVTAANQRALAAVAAAGPQLAAAAEGIERCLARGGRLVYAGAGTSGRIGVQDAAELPPTFGFDRAEVLLAGGMQAESAAKEGAEDDVVAAVADVDALAVGPDDALIGIAASGGTPYTVAAVKRARERGAFTVGIANSPDSPLLEAGDVGVLLDTGPEVLAGSTRLAAGTAQKAAINAISTAVLVRLGGAYGNLMVGMRAVNAKLRWRAVQIVAEATGLEEGEAAPLLESAGGDIRVAIVMAGTGVGAAEAADLLAAHGASVRAAIAAGRGG